MLISIDGMSHTGRKDLARAVARQFALPLLDVEALWNLLALQLTGMRVTADASPDYLERAAHKLISDGLDIELIDSGFAQVPEMTKFAETLRRFPLIRTRMANVARDWLVVSQQKAVVFGRDTGRAIAPHADHKVFLIGDATVRARRRSGVIGAADLAALRDEIVAEDKRAITTFGAPLRPAIEATVIDTTHTSNRAVFSHICELIAARAAWARIESEALKL